MRRYLATDEVDPDARVNLEARLHVLEATTERSAQREPAPAVEPEPLATARGPAARETPAPPAPKPTPV